MKKQGFTLVELLAVISLMGILMLLIVPSTANIIKKNKQKNYELQIRNIENAAKNWNAKNSYNGSRQYVTLNQLKLEKFIDEEIVDPRNKKCFNNDMLIEINTNSTPKVLEDTISTSDRCKAEAGNNKLLINNIGDLDKEYINALEAYEKVINFYNETEGITYEKNFEFYGKKRGIEDEGKRLGTVFVKINDLVFYTLIADNKAIYAKYYKTCENDNCVEDKILGTKKYQGFGSSTTVLDWDDSKNQVKKDIDAWYNSKNLDSYMVPLNIIKSYDIKSDGLLEKKNISTTKEMYSLMTPYESIICSWWIFVFTPTGQLFYKELDNYGGGPVGSGVLYNKNNQTVIEQLDINSEKLNLVYCQSNDCKKNIIIPLFNLKPTLKIESGSGTEEDPYILKK